MNARQAAKARARRKSQPDQEILALQRKTIDKMNNIAGKVDGIDVTTKDTNTIAKDNQKMLELLSKEPAEMARNLADARTKVELTGKKNKELKRQLHVQRKKNAELAKQTLFSETAGPLTSDGKKEPAEVSNSTSSCAHAVAKPQQAAMVPPPVFSDREQRASAMHGLHHGKKPRGSKKTGKKRGRGLSARGENSAKRTKVAAKRK